MFNTNKAYTGTELYNNTPQEHKYIFERIPSLFINEYKLNGHNFCIHELNTRRYMLASIREHLDLYPTGYHRIHEVFPLEGVGECETKADFEIIFDLLIMVKNNYFALLKMTRGLRRQISLGRPLGRADVMFTFV